MALEPGRKGMREICLRQGNRHGTSLRRYRAGSHEREIRTYSQNFMGSLQKTVYSITYVTLEPFGRISCLDMDFSARIPQRILPIYEKSVFHL